jgi:hypothetical protein
VDAAPRRDGEASTRLACYRRADADRRRAQVISLVPLTGGARGVVLVTGLIQTISSPLPLPNRSTLYLFVVMFWAVT